ncbi:SO2930 family diheme c-type cytochrome [Caulobacter sp. 17J65-9]|uniref:SO2930 family diheme c-type cytochrome n=1 Tax=Caulobacter sp. 17J65-9 TaxID=2709382 RepID=UPI0013CA25C8|nr:SO2930 family diheme c-type cytochrome [Caulobacter sp. 17J65-9]NEX92376.1 hypothetical protein [Caulobacter sp. 17J65-9]
MFKRIVALGLAAALLAACSRAPDHVVFHAKDNPARLSEWGLFKVGGKTLATTDRVVVYDLATPLFSDYAQKLRTVWLPEGATATYDETNTFDFPVGTVISKTFYYPTSGTDRPGDSKVVDKTTAQTRQSGAKGLDLKNVRLVETRILVRRENGWEALPYVWNADQTDAVLARAGESIAMTFADGARKTDFVYQVPNVNQCGGCHVQDFKTRKFEPIGLKARHLNHSFDGPQGEMNQLTRLQIVNYLKGAPAPDRAPRNAVWNDTREPLEARARAYLDANCSHCHSATGAARTTGLWLRAGELDPRQLGACKPPVAAGKGTGGHTFDIVPGDPDASIMPFRLASRNAGEMMPEAGRSLVHGEGLALIREWIANMDGVCQVTGESL